MAKIDNEIKELLKVLDMSEREQINYLYVKYQYDLDFDIGFADLAFRLRDEVKGSESCECWIEGTKKVFEYLHPEANSNYYVTSSYFTDTAQPPHWVVAALVAKLLQKGVKNQEAEMSEIFTPTEFPYPRTTRRGTGGQNERDEV